MIKAIDLKTTASESYINEYGNPFSYLSDIKHINIFVGENNSGKSRLMRAMLKSTDAILLTDEINSSFDSQVNSLRKMIKNAIDKFSATHPDIAPHVKHEEMDAVELFTYYKKYYEGKKLQDIKMEYPNQNAGNDLRDALNSLYDIITTYTLRKSNNSLNSLTKIYIPVLRGIENFNNYFNIQNTDLLDSITMNQKQRNALDEYKTNAGRIYKNKISNVYEINSNLIFTGENLYEDVRDKLLGKETDRDFIRDFENFISKHFYNNEGFTISPLISKEYLNVKIGSSQERPLHDLGDGIKQLICLLYKVFEQRDKEAFFFIEEPEINLHPGYQRKLIEILQQDEFSKLYFFITTHSNHLVDSCFNYDNISLFKFINVNKENSKFQVISTSANDIELLNLLGVNNSSVFMANTTIWVEGISDKIYISKYLNVYMKEKTDYIFKEDIDYAFVEYGGNNITHWSFESDDDISTINASGITNRAMIILDNDNDSARKAKRKKKLKKVFGDRYYELPVREIENTINHNVLTKYLFPDGNVLLKKGMDEECDGYETKDAILWKYIDSHYKTSKQYWNKNDNSLIGSKMNFAKGIVTNINSSNDLSSSAIKLCESIYNFIKKSNGDINS